jgi:hypothetical protein
MKVGEILLFEGSSMSAVYTKYFLRVAALHQSRFEGLAVALSIPGQADVGYVHNDIVQSPSKLIAETPEHQLAEYMCGMRLVFSITLDGSCSYSVGCLAPFRAVASKIQIPDQGVYFGLHISLRTVSHPASRFGRGVL